MELSHCDVGNHDMPAGEIGRCAVCRKGVCLKHQGNPDAQAGDLVACPRHVKQVAEMNQAAWKQMQARLKRFEGER